MRVRFIRIFIAAAVGAGLAVSPAAAGDPFSPDDALSPPPAPAAEAVAQPTAQPAAVPPAAAPEAAPAPAAAPPSGAEPAAPAGDGTPLPSLTAGNPSLPVGRLPSGEVFSLPVFAEQECREARPPALPALQEEASTSAAGAAPAADVVREPCPPSPFRPVPERPEVAGVLSQLTGRSRKNVQVGISRSSRYIPMIKGILEQMELPLDLISLPLVESNFHPAARSRAGAVGLWQFMERTARASGLRVDWWVDERLDPLAATRAAARHLKVLYEQFGDWELVLAAYNAGSGGVERAMKAHKADDFWDLVGKAGKRRLHRETQWYVPNFYAAMMILEEPQKFGFEAGPEEPLADAETVWVDSPVDLMTVARLAEADYELVRALNPALLRGCTPPNSGRFPLRVPAGTAEKVAERLLELSAEERLDFVRHTVAKGDTLWAIAKRYGSDVRSIQELNRFKDGKGLRVGKPIVVPVRRSHASKGSVPVPAPGGGGRDHLVQPGDTLSAIAREAGVSVKDLVRWNKLSRGGAIRPGQRLRTAPPEAAPREAVSAAAVPPRPRPPPPRPPPPRPLRPRPLRPRPLRPRPLRPPRSTSCAGGRRLPPSPAPRGWPSTTSCAGTASSLARRFGWGTGFDSAPPPTSVPCG